MSHIPVSMPANSIVGNSIVYTPLWKSNLAEELSESAKLHVVLNLQRKILLFKLYRGKAGIFPLTCDSVFPGHARVSYSVLVNSKGRQYWNRIKAFKLNAGVCCCASIARSGVSQWAEDLLFSRRVCLSFRLPSRIEICRGLFFVKDLRDLYETRRS